MIRYMYCKLLSLIFCYIKMNNETSFLLQYFVMIYPLFLYMSSDPRWECHHTRGSIPYTHNHTKHHHILSTDTALNFSTPYILPTPYCQHHTANTILPTPYCHTSCINHTKPCPYQTTHIVLYSNTNSPNQHHMFVRCKCQQDFS